MRKELQGFSESNYWRAGKPHIDFGHTLELARKFFDGQREVFEAYASKVRAEEPELADDILDDIGFYTFLHAEFVWHFALWRLQGLFEAMMVYQFLKRSSSQGLIGLKKKLNAMAGAGFLLADADRIELLAWGDVRNALSHAPPDPHGPVTLR